MLPIPEDTLSEAFFIIGLSGAVTFPTPWLAFFTPCQISFCPSDDHAAESPIFVNASKFCAALGFALANSPYASMPCWTHGIADTACPTFCSPYSTPGICVIVLPTTFPPSPSMSPAFRKAASPNQIFPEAKSRYVLATSDPLSATQALILSV